MLHLVKVKCQQLEHGETERKKDNARERERVIIILILMISVRRDIRVLTFITVPTAAVLSLVTALH